MNAAGFTIPMHELDVSFSRASGPGGQNVNKRDTRVELVFDLRASRALPPDMKRRARERLGARLDSHGRLRIVASSERTQAGNRRAALERFATTMERALRPPPPPRRPTKPSRAARARRVDSKVKRGASKRLRKAPTRDD